MKWENKKDILTKREEKKKKGKGEAPGIAVVIEDKPGLKEWWEACTGEGVTNSFGVFFSDAEIELLPKRLFRCLRTTESLADFVKKRGKLFLTLEDELNKLDPIGNSIRVTGEQIYADRVNNQPEKEQDLAYLDL